MKTRSIWRAFPVILSLLVGCAAESRQWKAGEEIGAFRFGKAILSAEGRIVMDGKDYGPYGGGDTARLEKDRDGNVQLLVNGEVRTPTGRPLPESLAELGS